MSNPKVSIYLSPEDKKILYQNAQEANTSMSSYLLQKGLETPIQSSKTKAQGASLLCQLYTFSDTLENPAQRAALKKLVGDLYGCLEN